MLSAATLSTTALAAWLVLALLAGVVLGAAAVILAQRRAGSAVPAPPLADDVPPPNPGARPALEVDDLPGFLEHPPGSPAPPPPAPAPAVARPATPTGATAVHTPATAGPARHSRRRGPAGEPGTRRTLLAMVLAAAVLVLVAVVVALASREEPTAPTGSGATPAPATGRPAPAPAPAPAPMTGPTGGEIGDAEVAAGALAARSVPLGDDGVAARATFGSVLLERRAVGVTVARPGVSTSTAGTRALAHVVLPAFNCLTREPPADPEAAGCARAATEYADLADPELRLRRDGDRLELAGRFPTYTRPREGPPTYTGRSYPITVTLAADGRERDGRVPATGVLRQGVHRTTTTGGPEQNVLQLR